MWGKSDFDVFECVAFGVINQATDVFFQWDIDIDDVFGRRQCVGNGGASVGRIERRDDFDRVFAFECFEIDVSFAGNIGREFEDSLADVGMK